MVPTSRRVQLATGIGTHLLEWDAAADHTVVLLHGFLDLSWAWVAMVEAGLAGRFHLVAPDFRGHGDSDWIGPGGYYHFVDYLADVDDLVAQVGRARVSIVGFSMGGSVAGYYAGAFPEKLHKLALLEGLGPPEASDAAPDRVRTWLESWRRVREKPARSYGSIAEAAARLRQTDPRLGAEMATLLAEHGTRVGDDGRLRFKHDPLHTSTGPTPFRVDLAAQFWRRITCPTLLVEAAETEYRFADAERARRVACFAHATSAILPASGHAMQRHQPAALARLLGDFLAD